MQRYSFLIEANVYMQEGLWDDIKGKAKSTWNSIKKGQKSSWGRIGGVDSSTMTGKKKAKDAIEKTSDALTTANQLKTGVDQIRSLIKGKGFKGKIGGSFKAGLKGGARNAAITAGEGLAKSASRMLRAAKLKRERRKAGGSTFKKDEE